MALFAEVYALVMMLPPMGVIHLGPAELIAAAGLIGWGHFELSLLSRYG